jgi:hypothetical protein
MGAALFGRQQTARLGSNPQSFDPLVYLAASWYPRVLNCRSSVSGSCHEPLQQVQQLQQLLGEVQQWVGPFHWAVHFVMSAQTGKACDSLRAEQKIVDLKNSNISLMLSRVYVLFYLISRGIDVLNLDGAVLAANPCISSPQPATIALLMH